MRQWRGWPARPALLPLLRRTATPHDIAFTDRLGQQEPSAYLIVVSCFSNMSGLFLRPNSGGASHD